MKLRKGDKILKPIHPNKGIETLYRGRMDALIDEMASSYAHWIKAQYRRAPPELAMDAALKVTAQEEQVGSSKLYGGNRVWHAYVDGKLLRGANGVGRSFKTQAAAEAAGLREAGPAGLLTRARPWDDPERWKTSILEAKIAPTPAAELERELKLLGVRWEKRFADAAPKMADWFSRSAASRSSDALRKILKDAGVSVKFQMNPVMRDAYQATLAENIGLIKSIQSQYHFEVQGMVMRSVTAGRDLGGLTKELEHRFGITRRRAAGIALDQNNLATATFVKVRQQQAGITMAVWLHSHAGKTPRPTHLANNGKPYDPALGWFDPDPKVRRNIWPGQLIRCRCVSRSVVRGFS